MGIVFLLLYLFTSFIFPAEIFPSLGPYHLPYWIGLGGLVVSIVLVFVRRGEPLRSIQVYILFVFFAVMILSWLVADHWLGAVPVAIKQFAPSLAMFVVTVCTVDSLRKLRVVTASVVFFSVVVLAQGFAAYHFGINKKMFVLDPAQWAEQLKDTEIADDSSGDDPDDQVSDDDVLAKRIRGLGMLHDPNDLALSFVAALPLVSLGMRRRTLRTLLEFLLSAALCYGVYLTHSRGGTLGLLFVLLVIAARRVGRWRAALLVGILAFGAMAVDIGGGRSFSPEDESAADRIDAWSEGLHMLKSQPLIGVGYRQFTEHHFMTAHNSFVLCFAETGLVGYFLWLSLLGISLLQLQKLKHLPDSVPPVPDIRRYASILQTAMMGFMVAAFFLSRTYVPFLYLLIGLSAALVLIAKKNDVPVVWPSYARMGSLIAAAELASLIMIYVIGRLHTVV
ncbi:MAG TPA: O-antigen ligase family protein [Bryobacteraceae bacterium]|nr:O-antigen ligase family protein [Bryobacteraceae bacterium]